MSKATYKLIAAPAAFDLPRVFPTALATDAPRTWPSLPPLPPPSFTIESLSCSTQLRAGRTKETTADAVRAKIFLSLMQVLSQVGTIFEIRFPPIYAFVLKWINVLQLDLFSLMPLECIFETNFHTKLLFRTLIPLGIMGFLALFSRICAMRGAKAANAGNTRSAASSEWLSTFLLNLVFTILFLIYPSTSTNIFSTFQYMLLHHDFPSHSAHSHGSPHLHSLPLIRYAHWFALCWPSNRCKPFDDGTWRLRADLLIDCNSDAHKLMYIYAGVMVAIYPIGAPALYAYLLFRCHGKALTRIKDIEVQRTMIIKAAQAEDENDRWESTAKKGEPRTAKLDAMVKQIDELKVQETALFAALPGYIQVCL